MVNESTITKFNHNPSVIKKVSLPYQYSLFDNISSEVYASDIYTHRYQNTTYRDITNHLDDTDAEKSTKGKVISLFSGAGGFDIGLEQAGFETVACVEIDPDCRATLRHNRKQWTLFEDNHERIAFNLLKLI